jgi:hypothetical protein
MATDMEMEVDAMNTMEGRLSKRTKLKDIDMTGNHI